MAKFTIDKGPSLASPVTKPTPAFGFKPKTKTPPKTIAKPKTTTPKPKTTTTKTKATEPTMAKVLEDAFGFIPKGKTTTGTSVNKPKTGPGTAGNTGKLIIPELVPGQSSVAVQEQLPSKSKTKTKPKGPGTPGNTGNLVIPEFYPELTSVAVQEQSPAPGTTGNDPGLDIVIDKPKDKDKGKGKDKGIITETPTKTVEEIITETPGATDETGAVDGGGTSGETSGGTSTVDAAAELDAAINALLEGDFIGFQGDRATELRRLQNLRNQLYGDPEFGTTGSVQRQEGLDTQARRRLAAQRAMSGMLQGGAYAGGERGLGTIQRADQDYAMQEMLRPFREQTAADRLREFGLDFDPTSRVFDLTDWGLGDWTTQTYGGREAAARARQAALQQLAQRGIQF